MTCRPLGVVAGLVAGGFVLNARTGGGVEHRAVVTQSDAMKEERGSRSSRTGGIYDLAAEEGKLRVEYEVTYTEEPTPIIAHRATTCEHDPEAESAESAGSARESEPSDSEIVKAWDEKNGLKWVEKNFGYDSSTL